MAVGQNLWPLEQLGPPFRVLRAFRPFLFLDTAAVAGSPLLRELPPTVLVHHLFSRAPPALQSPLTRSSLTPAQVWCSTRAGCSLAEDESGMNNMLLLGVDDV